MTRREAREQAFILIFAKSFRSESVGELIDIAEESGSLVLSHADLLKENYELRLDPFAEQTALKIEQHIEELDERIERLSFKWKKNRISKVAFAVLRLALYEMLFDDEIPLGVSINEAVDIAKKYAGEEDSSFVNGVLGSAAKELEAKPSQGSSDSIPDQSSTSEEQD